MSGRDERSDGENGGGSSDGSDYGFPGRSDVSEGSDSGAYGRGSGTRRRTRLPARADAAEVEEQVGVRQLVGPGTLERDV